MKEQYRKTLLLLAQNPYRPSLRLHPLKGKLAALHSVSINISYRITLEMIITGQEIILVNVGSHDEVINREQLSYGKTKLGANR